MPDTVYFDPAHRRITTDPGPTRTPLPTLEGHYSTDEPDLTWAAHDFGGIVHHRPQAVVHAATPDDVVAVHRFAARHRIPVVPRAEGHSTAGQAQTPDGLVLDMRGLDTVHHLADDHVVVDAGARWSRILAVTLAAHRTPPVLTDYLELSVGGTLSVGGLGGATHHHGAQTDNVVELDVVTPDGTRRTCSPTTNPDLFDTVRAGGGRQGTILRATLRLVPAHRYAVTHRRCYDDLADFLADQQLVMTDHRFDHLEGRIKPDTTTGRWTYHLDGTRYQPEPTPTTHTVPTGLHHRPGTEETTTTDYGDFLNRMADDVALLRTLGPWHHPHPWNNVLLPAHATHDVVTRALARLRPHDLGDTGLILLYPFPRNRITTPRLHLPDSTTVFLLSVLKTAPPDNPDTLQTMLADNHRLRQHTTRLGGTTYLDPITRPHP